jgi:uncharacterized protein YndB with AHSA1/START domain
MTQKATLDARELWQVQIDAPIETVWNTIVATDVVMPHLFGAVCEAPEGLAKGHSFRMMSRNGKMVTVVAEVLEFSPPHRFSHTIHFTQNAGEIPGRTTYELREKSGGTELTLISEAVSGSKTAKMGKSGPFIIANIKSIAETGKPTTLGSLITVLSPVMTRFMPTRARAENWPKGKTSE